MNRTEFSSDEVADIVFKIVGEIEPVGETNTDNVRFSNLQTLLNTLDILIDEVTFVLPCKDCVHFGETENPCFILCHYGCDEHMIDVSPDWFCADGERRC